MGKAPIRRNERGHVLNALATQRSGLHAATAGGTGSIPVQGTRILHATQHGREKKKRRVHHFTPLPPSVLAPGVALISVLAPGM